MRHRITGHNLGAASQHHHPVCVSLGVPPDRPELSRVQVCNGQGQTLLSQCDVLDRYANGSVRTELVRFIPRGEEPFVLAWDIDESPPPGPILDPETQTIDNGCFTACLADGPRQGLVIHPHDASAGRRRPWSFYTEVELASGERRSSRGLEGTLSIEENGPAWCSVKISGAYGSTPLNYELRLQVAAGLPVLYWQFRLGNMSEDEICIRSAECYCANMGVSSSVSLVCHAENEAVLREVGTESLVGPEVPPFLSAEAEGMQLAWGIRDLNLLYPKALFARADLLGWSALPAGVPPERLRFQHSGLQRGFWFEPDGSLRMPPCFSWRTDGFLAWGPDAPALAQIAVDPPLVPAVLFPGTSMAELGAATSVVTEPIRREADRLLSSFELTQQQERLFGLMDYGDLVTGPHQDESGQHGVWLNGEHDASFGPLLHYAAYGDPRYFRAGCNIARHQMDIDTRRRGEAWTVSKHCVGHVSDRCENGHFWLEGLSLFYRLTGDRDALEVVERTADWLAQDMAATVPGEFPTVREAGVSLWMLSVAYEVFPDRHYLLEIMEPHVQAMVDLQRPDGSWHPYIKTEHSPFHHPRFRKTLHLSGLAMGLMRYAQVSHDRQIALVLHRFLRHSLIEGDLLLPGGDALFYENSFALPPDQGLPEREREQLLREWDGSYFEDGRGASYLQAYFDDPDARGSDDGAAPVPEPWDLALFPFLEVIAWVCQQRPAGRCSRTTWNGMRRQPSSQCLASASGRPCCSICRNSSSTT
jgi:hypothetical protein